MRFSAESPGANARVVHIADVSAYVLEGSPLDWRRAGPRDELYAPGASSRSARGAVSDASRCCHVGVMYPRRGSPAFCSHLAEDRTASSDIGTD